MLELSGTDIKAAVVTLLVNVKENMFIINKQTRQFVRRRTKNTMFEINLQVMSHSPGM